VTTISFGPDSLEGCAQHLKMKTKNEWPANGKSVYDHCFVAARENMANWISSAINSFMYTPRYHFAAAMMWKKLTPTFDENGVL
jgi:hypothetical protein